MRKNGFQLYCWVKWLSTGLTAPGTMKCELNYNPNAFSFRCVVCDFTTGCRYLAGEWRKKDTTPTRHRMTVTTDHYDFSKHNLGTLEEWEVQAHFPRQFRGEVNVCKTCFDPAQQSDLCCRNVFECLSRFLFLFFFLSSLPMQSMMTVGLQITQRTFKHPKIEAQTGGPLNL